METGCWKVDGGKLAGGKLAGKRGGIMHAGVGSCMRGGGRSCRRGGGQRGGHACGGGGHCFSHIPPPLFSCIALIAPPYTGRRCACHGPASSIPGNLPAAPGVGPQQREGPRRRRRSWTRSSSGKGGGERRASECGTMRRKKKAARDQREGGSFRDENFGSRFMQLETTTKVTVEICMLQN